MLFCVFVYYSTTATGYTHLQLIIIIIIIIIIYKDVSLLFCRSRMPPSSYEQEHLTAAKEFTLSSISVCVPLPKTSPVFYVSTNAQDFTELSTRVIKAKGLQSVCL